MRALSTFYNFLGRVGSAVCGDRGGIVEGYSISELFSEIEQTSE